MYARNVRPGQQRARAPLMSAGCQISPSVLREEEPYGPFERSESGSAASRRRRRCHPFDQAARALGKILVVDDEEDVRQAIVDILRHDGYEVCEASNGTSALECLERESFALVITDIVMPQMDGLSVIKTAGQRGYRTPTL